MTNLPNDRDPRERVWEDRADRLYSQATYSPGKLILKIVLAVILVSLVLGFIGCVTGIIGGYGNEAKRVVGVENVKEQNTAIIEDWESMEAAAANACGAKTAAKESGDPVLVEDPALAYKATYRRIRVDYNRRMANLYEAQAVRGLPLPHNLKSYPKIAPTVEEKMAEVCG